MGIASVTAKPKSKAPGRVSHSVPGGVRAHPPAPVPPIAASPGAFYAAGPVMSLGTPVQAKLTVGHANDPYEQEADRVAEQVTQGQRAPSITALPPGGLSHGLQPQSEEEKKEEPPLSQPQLLQRQAADDTRKEQTEPPQPFLLQRQPAEEKPQEDPERPQPFLLQRQAAEETTEDKELEQPAAPIQRQGPDEMREDDTKPPQPLRVQRQAAEDREDTELPQPQFVQRQAADETKEKDAEPPQPLLVQRQTAAEKPEEPEQPQPLLVQRQATDETKQQEPEEPAPQPRLIQRRAANASSTASSANPDAVSQAIRRRGIGEPLSPALQQVMGAGTGLDFRHVHVHRDAAAHSANQALKARAFTHGSDIWLGPGESPSDLRLMAHEATHVVQQGGTSGSPATVPAPVAQMRNAEDEPVQRQPAPGASTAAPGTPAAPPGTPAAPGAAAEDVAPGEIDLKGLTELAPEKVPEPIARYLEQRRRNTGLVKMRFGTLAEGPVEVEKNADRYLVKRGPMPLRHPLFARLGETAPALQPSLIISIGRDRQIKGFVGLKLGKQLVDLDDQLRQMPAILGLTGFTIPGLKGLTNTLEGGRLVVGVKDFPISLGKILSGTFTFELIDGDITTLGGKVEVAAKGLASGSLELQRALKGGAIIVTGKAAIALNLPKNFSGSVEVAWDGENVSGMGKIGYTGEKLSGTVTIQLMEKGLADQLEKEKKAPPEAAPVAPSPAPGTAPGKPKAEEYVVFGEGDLTFAFTDWLNGTAHVIVDPKGYVTIIGKITPQKEFPLFEPKNYNKELFKLEARAAYGIPVVGNIFIFANVGLSAFATLQGKFYNIIIQGTYSTDPEKAKDFSIQGTLNVSASAGLTLRAEAGVGIEILDHDIKAGAGINASAGVKGYAEATPIIGYREKIGQPGEDKKGQFFIRGDVEVVAQPFLALGGDLFVELDSPWWSPAPDKKWTWPLFGKEWPIGGSFGFGLTVDYVFGSGQAPTLEFKKPDFSAEKFMTDMVDKKAKEQSAAPGEQKGKWNEHNSKAAEPPAGPSKPGDAQVGKAAPPPPAKPKVQPGGPKKATTPADPNAKTAEGKSVKQLQQEALQKGKLPPEKDKAPGQPLSVPAAKQKIIAALQSQLPQGASQVADVNKVLADVAGAVKPVFTNLRAEEVMPGKPKSEGAIGFKVKAKEDKGGDLLLGSVRYSKTGGALAPEERWKKGVDGVKRGMQQLEKRGISEGTIRSVLPRWQSGFSFTSLTLDTKQLPWIIEGEMSPGKPVTTVTPGGNDADKFAVTRAEIERRFRHRLDDTYVFALVDQLWTVRRGPGQATGPAAKTQMTLVHKGNGSYSLEGLAKHASNFVIIENNQYMLRPDVRGKAMRRTFYPHDYIASVRQWKQDMLSTPRNQGGLRHPTDHNKYYWNGKYWDDSGDTVATLDHQKPHSVVENWNAEGRLTDQDTRKLFYNDTTTIEIVPKTDNSSMGGGQAGSAIHEVGEKFRGPGE